SVDQHVTVVGLDLRGVQDEESVPVLQVAEIAPGIELAVLGEHDAVERALVALALQQLQVRLDRRPAVVRAIRVQMQIENHARGRTSARSTWGGRPPTPPPPAMPMRTASGAQSTTLVMRRSPSASSTTASTYGSSSRKPGAWFWYVTVKLWTVPLPLARTHSVADDRHTGHTARGGKRFVPQSRQRWKYSS